MSLPGLQVAAAHQCRQSYGGKKGPPPLDPPNSWYYTNGYQKLQALTDQEMQVRLMQRNGVLEGDFTHKKEQVIRNQKRTQDIPRGAPDENKEHFMKIQNYFDEQKEKLYVILSQLDSQDMENMKISCKESLLDELLRKQDTNGVFDEVNGTILPLNSYDEEDPVCKWSKESQGEDITGQNWDPAIDAKYINSALEEFDANEDEIITVICTRSNSQRISISKEYQTQFDKELVEVLVGQRSANYRELIYGLFETPARFDAWCLKKAIHDKDQATIIEILLTRTNSQIQEMSFEYDKVTYDKQSDKDSTLEKDLDEHIEGELKGFIIAMAKGVRQLIDRDTISGAILEDTTAEGKWTGFFNIDNNLLTDEALVKKIASEMFENGLDKSIENELFNTNFSRLDYYTLTAVYCNYVKICQKDLINTPQETSVNGAMGLKAIAQCLKARPMYFADRLYQAMQGIVTDDCSLIRIIISRSEVDMHQIKPCFFAHYKQTLWNALKDTSGHHKKLLQAIVK